MLLVAIAGLQVIVPLGIAAAVIVFEWLVEEMIKDDKTKSKYRRVARGLFIGGLALLFHLTLESVHKLETVEKELSDVNKKTAAFDFFKPYETIQSLDDKSTFQKLLQAQLNQTTDRLKEISKGELNLSREEVVPVWESLISNFAVSEIHATNVVSISDWDKFSPNQGLEAHEIFLQKKNTVFKRLFIYDDKDSLSLKGTLDLASSQTAMAKRLKIGNDRFEVRMIDKNSIDNTTYGDAMYKSFGSLDIVIFDRQCMLQTFTEYKNHSYEIVNGLITDNDSKIKNGTEMFNKIWQKAESMDQFKKKYSVTKLAKQAIAAIKH